MLADGAFTVEEAWADEGSSSSDSDFYAWFRAHIQNLSGDNMSRLAGSPSPEVILGRSP